MQEWYLGVGSLLFREVSSVHVAIAIGRWGLNAEGPLKWSSNTASLELQWIFTALHTIAVFELSIWVALWFKCSTLQCKWVVCVHMWECVCVCVCTHESTHVCVVDISGYIYSRGSNTTNESATQWTRCLHSGQIVIVSPSDSVVSVGKYRWQREIWGGEIRNLSRKCRLYYITPDCGLIRRSCVIAIHHTGYPTICTLIE